MFTISRWHVITIGLIVILLSLGQLLHYNSYDSDVLAYVSTKAKQGSDKLYDKYGKASTSSTPVTVTATVYREASTVTHTATTTESVTATTTESVFSTVTAEAENKSEDEHKEECKEKIAISVDPFKALNATIKLPQKTEYDPTGGKNSEIIILTATDGKGHNDDIPGMVEMVMSNRDAYCEHHGYIHHFVDLSAIDLDDVSAVWKKLPAITEAFNKYPEAKWVFWLDLDAIIMTPEQDLQSLVLSKDGMRRSYRPNSELLYGGPDETKHYFPVEPDWENVDFIIGQDHGGINAGTFILRRSEWSQWFLDLWADPLFMYASFGMKEQDAILHMLKHHRSVRDHTLMVKQRSINAYVEGAEWQEWHDGDLLVHLAGCWVTDACGERWNKFWEMRGHLKRDDADSLSIVKFSDLVKSAK